MPESAWAPVVYGRTRRADVWWRALPAFADPQWLKESVHAVVAGGRRLGDAPRFLLTQDRRYRLVGVACQARELSETMNSDGSRALYCFVGWVAERTADEPHVPELAELQRRYVEWASPEYERWVREDWDVHPADARRVHETPVAPPPWTADEPGCGEPLPAAREAWPAAMAGELWERGRASTAAYALAVGWQAVSDAPFAITQLAAQDVSERRALPEPPEPEPEVEPEPWEEPQRRLSVRRLAGHGVRLLAESVDLLFERTARPEPQPPAGSHGGGDAPRPAPGDRRTAKVLQGLEHSGR